MSRPPPSLFKFGAVVDLLQQKYFPPLDANYAVKHRKSPVNLLSWLKRNLPVFYVSVEWLGICYVYVYLINLVD
jgi:hypothetical protein